MVDLRTQMLVVVSTMHASRSLSEFPRPIVGFENELPISTRVPEEGESAFILSLPRVSQVSVIGLNRMGSFDGFRGRATGWWEVLGGGFESVNRCTHSGISSVRCRTNAIQTKRGGNRSLRKRCPSVQDRGHSLTENKLPEWILSRALGREFEKVPPPVRGVCVPGYKCNR